MITYEDVGVTFGKFTALKHVDFHVEPGSFLHVVGPNGSGKTTLMKTLVGLLKPTSGNISINAKRMGYLPQKLEQKTQMPMTVKEVIYSGFSHQKIRATSKDCALIKTWLTRMGIPDLFDESMMYLSGGQQQRVYLIRALIGQPDLLILDEPTSALDPSFREKFYQLLKDIQQENHMTIINVTHDLTDAIKEDACVMYVDKTVKYFGSYQSFHAFEHEGHHHA